MPDLTNLFGNIDPSQQPPQPPPNLANLLNSLGGGAPAPNGQSPYALPVPPPTPAQQNYSDVLNSMPKRPKGNILGSLAAMALGGLAGAQNVKTGYYGQQKTPLNAQPAVDALTGKTGYNQQMQDWQSKLAGAKTAADEEAQRVRDAVSQMDVQERLRYQRQSQDENRQATKDWRQAQTDARTDAATAANDTRLQGQFNSATNPANTFQMPSLPASVMQSGATPDAGLPTISAGLPATAPPAPEGFYQKTLPPELQKFAPPDTAYYGEMPNIHKGLVQVTPELSQSSGGVLPAGSWLPPSLIDAQIKQAQPKTEPRVPLEDRVVNEYIQSHPGATLAQARAATQPPPPGGEGTWTLAEDANGKPVLFNSKTSATKAAPDGIVKPGTADKKAAAQAKQLESLNEDENFVRGYLTNGHYTGPNDEALLERFFNATKPSTGFRMNQAQISLLTNARSWANSARAAVGHVLGGTIFSEEQRRQIAQTTLDIIGAKRKAFTSPAPAASGTLPGGISLADIDAEIARRKGQ